MSHLKPGSVRYDDLLLRVHLAPRLVTIDSDDLIKALESVVCAKPKPELLIHRDVERLVDQRRSKRRASNERCGLDYVVVQVRATGTNRVERTDRLGESCRRR